MAVRGAGSRREGRMGEERRKTYIAIKSRKKEKNYKKATKSYFQGTVDLLIYN